MTGVFPCYFSSITWMREIILVLFLVALVFLNNLAT
jgi:hypothetical protein